MKTMSSDFFEVPHTKPGWWAIGLMGAFVVMFIINATVFMPSSEPLPLPRTLLIFYGIFMMLCGLSAGVVGLISVIRAQERSWLVWLTILPGLFVLFFVLGEFLVPH